MLNLEWYQCCFKQNDRTAQGNKINDKEFLYDIDLTHVNTTHTTQSCPFLLKQFDVLLNIPSDSPNIHALTCWYVYWQKWQTLPIAAWSQDITFSILIQWTCPHLDGNSQENCNRNYTRPCMLPSIFLICRLIQWFFIGITTQMRIWTCVEEQSNSMKQYHCSSLHTYKITEMFQTSENPLTSSNLF
jgi:hypothetical protein